MLTANAKRKLYQRCMTPIDGFRHLGDVVDTVDGPTIFIDRGTNVLAVAHLDYVKWRKPTLRDGIVRCPQLDDRLGVWAILDLLPALGVDVDVLLTDSEEVGRSTGENFTPPREYHWMFQFDRAGTDVVLYQYDTPALRARLADWTIGNGAFSDISSMEHLGCSGMNFGIGYHQQHTFQCYAHLADTIGQCCRFAKFWREHRDTPMPHSEWSADEWSDNWSDDSRDWSGNGLWWECPCGRVNCGTDDDCYLCDIPQYDAVAYGYDR